MRRNSGHPWSSLRGRRGETPTCWALHLCFHTHAVAVVWLVPCVLVRPVFSACPRVQFRVAASSAVRNCCSWGAAAAGAPLCSGGPQSVRQHVHFIFHKHAILKRLHNFFYINSDSFHTLTFRPSPTAQIRIMVLGAWWDLCFQQLPLLFIFQLKKHKHQLLKRTPAVSISSRHLHGYPFCLKTWAFYTFD